MPLEFVEIAVVLMSWLVVLLSRNVDDSLGVSWRLDGGSSIQDITVWVAPVVVVCGCIASLVLGTPFWLALVTPIVAVLLLDGVAYGFAIPWRHAYIPKGKGGSWSDETYIRLFEGLSSLVGFMELAVRFIIAGVMGVVASVLYAAVAYGIMEAPSAIANGDQDQGVFLVLDRHVFGISLFTTLISVAFLVVGVVCLRLKGLSLRRKERRQHR